MSALRCCFSSQKATSWFRSRKVCALRNSCSFVVQCSRLKMSEPQLDEKLVIFQREIQPAGLCAAVWPDSLWTLQTDPVYHFSCMKKTLLLSEYEVRGWNRIGPSISKRLWRRTRMNCKPEAEAARVCSTCLPRCKSAADPTGPPGKSLFFTSLSGLGIPLGFSRWLRQPLLPSVYSRRSNPLITICNCSWLGT